MVKKKNKQRQKSAAIKVKAPESAIAFFNRLQAGAEYDLENPTDKQCKVYRALLLALIPRFAELKWAFYTLEKSLADLRRGFEITLYGGGWAGFKDAQRNPIFNQNDFEKAVATIRAVFLEAYQAGDSLEKLQQKALEGWLEGKAEKEAKHRRVLECLAKNQKSTLEVTDGK